MMNRLAAALALVLLPAAAWAQTVPTVNLHPEYQSSFTNGTAQGYVPSVVVLCPDATGGDVAQVCSFGGGSGSSTVTGTVTANQGTPAATTAPWPVITENPVGTYAPAPSNTIATANTYQQVFAAGTQAHGGCLQNLSAASTASLFVDWSSGVAAGGTTLSYGAYQVDSPATAGKVGGQQCWPATTTAVFVYGPASAVFHATGG